MEEDPRVQPPSSPQAEGFVTVEEAAEILYRSDHPVLVGKVARLAQAHVLASRIDGGLLLVRPANVTVHGRLPA